MGRFEGKVAFITGGARGQGRSHAVLLAEEGADIITVDLCGQIGSVEYPMATSEDMAETVRLVESTGRRIVARQADVRDFEAIRSVVDEGFETLGRLDIVIANAGIMPITGELGQQRRAFYDAVDVMLTGSFHTCEAAIPLMIEQGSGGAIVITSSTAGLRGFPGSSRQAGAGVLGYTAAKHGVVGLMRAYANALAPHNIRCNTVHPSGVDSPMANNDAFARLVASDPDILDRLANPLPVRHLECVDVSNAILFLCSDEARYVTGVTFPVDAGYCNK